MISERKLANAVIIQPLFQIEDYKSWKKVVRITAYVMRFVNKLRKVTLSEENESKDYFNNLSKEEIKKAENYWLKYVQQGMQIDEKYTPFVDENGLQRVMGRIKRK